MDGGVTIVLNENSNISSSTEEAVRELDLDSEELLAEGYGEDEENEESIAIYEEFNPYQFIHALPLYETVAPEIQTIALPCKTRKSPDISLVLDLDETLVHCSVEAVEDASFVRNKSVHNIFVYIFLCGKSIY